MFDFTVRRVQDAGARVGQTCLIIYSRHGYIYATFKDFWIFLQRILSSFTYCPSHAAKASPSKGAAKAARSTSHGHVDLGRMDSWMS